MTNITYQFIRPDDEEYIQLIANWYLKEWDIPIPKTIEKINKLQITENEFQVIMLLDRQPVATGGLYNHVGLLDKEPRFDIYKNWLALVYTIPEHRNKGLGNLICTHIQNYSNTLGLKEIYLFTHTAESLYLRLDWQPLERLALGGRSIVVMKKNM